MKSVLKWVGAKHNIMASLKHVLPKGGREKSFRNLRGQISG